MLLTYGSATLRQADLTLLEPHAWLNDAVITFYQEYLAKTRLAGSKNVVLMDPCAVAELQYSQFTGDPDQDEDLIDMFAPLKLDKADLILFPMNDNTDKFKANGGSHWSLLVFHRTSGWHYLDSASSGVSPQAI